jgi:uncharacterized membrane protein
MSQRPRIQPPLSQNDQLMDHYVAVTLVIAWLLALLTYWKAPAQIPTHFDWSGKADGMGSKLFLFVLPVLFTGLWALLRWVKKNPHLHNYAQPITNDNAAAAYASSNGLLRQVHCVINTLLVYLLFELSMAIKNGKNTIGFFPVFIFVGLILLIIIRHLRRMPKV